MKLLPLNMRLNGDSEPIIRHFCLKWHSEGTNSQSRQFFTLNPSFAVDLPLRMTLDDLYKRFGNIVFNLALQYTRLREDAEEITQDVFIKVHDKLHTFRQESDIGTWIYRITIHQSLDHIRARQRKKRLNLWNTLPLLPEQLPHMDHPGIRLEQKEELARIFACLDRLPENQQTVVILLKIEQKTQQETALIMNLSVKAVESLFQRAKKNLQECLHFHEGKPK